MAAQDMSSQNAPSQNASSQNMSSQNTSSQDVGSDVRKHAAKRRPHRIWHGYGFLPGYRTPDRIAYDNARARGLQVWYGSPRWYHGQWNHGGFGPCWTETPIGEIWNCGK